eukprot:5986656-Prymnesium_polylepis.1
MLAAARALSLASSRRPSALARHDLPRPEAGEHPARRGGPHLPHRFRPLQGVGLHAQRRAHLLRHAR